MSKINDELDSVLKLTELSLNDPEIRSDQKLNELIVEIRKEALKGVIFYDYKRELLRYVSSFSRRNNFRVPEVLLKLIAIVKTPKGWSGF
ncbi:bacteriocin immunity protein [Enterococcus hirae]|uniref:bacteriocin immunity protein n=1 Tax=Enterococcus sp. C63 TaxID=3231324 RepID=UPI0019DC7896|nr:bacteriocin immunity protein [Enterococcus hirae]EMF0131122.1 bacteriocin immunity protein [Enterococcus hirae]EMF0450002.1 bacteriocin immunity protein [Enterococcus hirae]EMF0517368.1 bacteriocin immunity protein [Enterococcus hirae]EMF0519700.1 bacteriocin immunity protein [Enterococcus hirae]